MNDEDKDDSVVDGVSLLRTISGRLDAAPTPTDQSIAENREALIAGVASSFLEKRLSGNVELESLKGSLVSAILQKLPDMPLDMMISTLDIVNKATASDSAKLLDILSKGSGNNTQGGSLNIFVNQQQPKEVRHDPPKVGNKDYRKLSMIQDAYSVLIKQAESAEINTASTPATPVETNPRPPEGATTETPQKPPDDISGDDL